ncbi:hypothetical protein R0381_002580 [Jeongeupia wiesaeckerbachi]|uniref:hypothetical protein n=1 Tax=Jeongeupia wiesaeckerbachi TaxID=3051218 RepID=UPI003D801CDC
MKLLFPSERPASAWRDNALHSFFGGKYGGEGENQKHLIVLRYLIQNAYKTYLVKLSLQYRTTH